MSGELTPEVVLADAGDGAVLRLVRAAGTLFAQPDFAPAALVGGLAVTLRLATAHRATNDVDTVADGDRPREVALDYVGDAGPGARLEIDGVKVDVMATDPLPDRVDDLPDDELDRLFVLGHRWALESAEPVAVRVLSPRDGSAEPLPLTVATSPALVACKFHAIADRRAVRSQKRESDAVDLVRLIGELVRPSGPAEPFLDAPFDLAELVSVQAQRWFVDDATRTARLLRLASVPGDAIMEPDEIAALGEAFVAIANDESFAVEFKSTARWNLEESRKDKRMEDSVVKTVAAFLNADGGVLLIGVADDRAILGLEHDCAVVDPANADGFVNWLTGHLIRALRNPAVMRTRTRIETVDGAHVCRVDVARSSVPVRARMSDKDDVFWVRMNNSSRAWPDEEIAEYVADHWGARLS